MKDFFKTVFASALGFILAGILFIMLLGLILASVSAALDSGTETAVKQGTVLLVKLDGPVSERTQNDPFQRLGLSGFSESTIGLNDIIKNIEKAKRDDRIKGILLDLNNAPAGRATVEEMRNALSDFRTSGKFIYAFGDYYSQTAYYLATTADRIYLHPEGAVDFRGLGMEMMFLKGALAKLEIEPQVIRHGKYKSAIEPLVNDKMSAENRTQLQALMDGLWDHMLGKISSARKISVDTLRQLADDYTGRDPKAALKSGMIDRVAYYDEFLSDLGKASGWAKDDQPKFVELRKYTKAAVQSERPYSSNKVAVIYLVGSIGEGEGNDESIGSETAAKEIRKARLDTSIKAIVLRINSPGGSSLASDVIWREVTLARKAKPVVASMGDYAASGGYYIACAADSIVAEPTTITGSIGVFGLMYNAQKLFNNKLGITFDTIKTSRMADLGSMTRPMRPDERAMIEQEIERIYQVFISHVAEGRRMKKSDVDSIGQGRVWSGTDALGIGLVDRLGDIDDAVKTAARMAKLDNYRTVQLPRQKPFAEKLMEELQSGVSVYFAKKELGENYRYYSEVKSLIDQQGILARMPYTLEFR